MSIYWQKIGLRPEQLGNKKETRTFLFSSQNEQKDMC